tara:strand:+ start:2852 stop:3742 length:891 start_codon:yes stop_codon:yes gene_type:complete
MLNDSLIELSLVIKNEFVEPVSYVFKKFCDYDFVISEDIEYNPDEDEERPISELITIKSYIDDNDNKKIKISSIQGSLALVRMVCEIPELTIKTIYKKDWAEQKFPSIEIGKKFIITNDKSLNSSSKFIININPGLGFGTGHHPTTKMMLEIIEKYSFISKNVLDFGCGSGILSIAAKKLKAQSVMAIDSDDLAISSAKENINFSELSEIELRVGSIEILDPEKKFDFIFANISSSIITKYSDKIFSLLSKQGILLCSGILNVHMKNTLKKLEESGLTLINSYQEQDWSSLEMKID